MTVLARLQADVSFGTTTAAVQQQVDVGIVPTPDPAQVQIDIGFDADAPGLAQPSQGLFSDPGGGSTFTAPTTIPGATARRVRTYFSWQVEDVDPATWNVEGGEVSASLSSCTRAWGHQVVASTGRTRDAITANPLGYETDTYGPPPGFQQSVKLELTLEDVADRTARTTWPLIDNAESTRMRRRVGRDGHVMEMSGSGVLARLVDRDVEYTLAPDHGLTHGEIARAVLILVGLDEDLIEVDPAVGWELSNPVSLDCVPGVGAVKDVLRAAGYVLVDTPRGTVDAISLDHAETPALTLTAFDVVAESFEVESASDGPSCVRVIGTKAEPPPNIPRVGLVTETTVTETTQTDYTLPLASASQAAGLGTVTPTFNVSPVIPSLLTDRLTVKRTYSGGCLVRVETIDEGYYNPIKARYRIAGTADLTINDYEFGWFFGSIPVADDDQELYAYEQARFMVRQHTLLEITYDTDGVRTSSTERVRRWYNPPAALKERTDITDSWEVTLHRANQDIRAGGDGVLFDQERFFEGPDRPDDSFPGSATQRVVFRDFQAKDIAYIGSDPTLPSRPESRFQVAVETTTTGYEIPFGATFLYADGTESSKGNAIGRQTEFVRVENSAEATDATRTVITTGRDGDGNVLPSVVQTGVGGGMPAMEVCTAEKLDRDSSRPFEATVCVSRRDPDGDLVTDQTRTHEITTNYVETPDEALVMARRELNILLAPRITLQLASPNPTLDAGATLWLYLPDLGYPGDRMIIEDVGYTIANEGAGQVVTMYSDLFEGFEANP